MAADLHAEGVHRVPRQGQRQRLLQLRGHWYKLADAGPAANPYPMSMPRRFSSHWSCLWDRIHAKFRDVFALGTGMAMHRIPIRTPLRFVCMLILLAPVVSSVANAQSPCEQIKAACTNAGFVQGGASSGTGLWRDCVEPILKGRSHSKKATKPLLSRAEQN